MNRPYGVQSPQSVGFLSLRQTGECVNQKREDVLILPYSALTVIGAKTAGDYCPHRPLRIHAKYAAALFNTKNTAENSAVFLCYPQKFTDLFDLLISSRPDFVYLPPAGSARLLRYVFNGNKDAFFIAFKFS